MSKILIVEDDQDLAREVASRLQKSGHSCGVHPRGERVVDIVRNESVDLIILDIMLPGPSGFQVCREIRSDEALYTLPIIFLSSMDSHEEVQHGLDQGADSYVTKPFSIDELVRRVEALLQSTQGSHMTDSVTALPNSEGTRKSVQQHLSRNEAFGIACIEMLGLREFTEKAGTDGQHKALRHLARAAKAYAEDLSLDEGYVLGHLGGGYFIILLPLENIKEYCERVLTSWDKHLQHLLESCELSGQDLAMAKSRRWLELCACITSRDMDDLSSVKHLLETLQRLRQTISDGDAAGIHLDRRLH